MQKVVFCAATMLIPFYPNASWTATVGPGTITTPVFQSSGGTTTIVGDTTINTTGSGGNGVNITNGTVELGGPNIRIESNSTGIFLSSSSGSTPAFLTSTPGSILLIVTSGASNSFGISAIGASNTPGVPSIFLANATIQTSGTFSDAITLSTGATATLSNVTTETTGANARGIVLNSNNTLTGNGVTLTSQGTSAQGILTFNSTLNLTNLTLNTAGTTAQGLQLNNNSNVILGTSTITTTGSQSTGALVSNSNLTLLNSAINTTGDNSQGVNLSGSNATMNLDTATITTEGLNATGILVSGALLIGDHVSVNTTDTNAYGIIANNANLNLNNSDIDTQGNSSRGISLTTNSTLTADSLTLNTTGTNAIGISASSSALTLNNSNLSTQTNSSHGISLESNSTLNADNLTINTTGTSAIGINASSSTSTVNNSSINTQTNSSHGISLTSNSTLNADNITINTYGTNANGITANNSTLTVNNSSMNTQTTSSHGISLTNSSTLNADNLTINTNGAGSRSINVTASNVTLNGSQITTQGANAHGIGIQTAGTLNANNTRITSSGLNAAALYMTANALATSNTASFNAAELTSAQGAAIAISGGTNSISLNNSIISSPLYWLHVGQSAASLTAQDNEATLLVAPSTATLTINHSTLTGAALVDSGNVANLELTNNTLWNVTDSSNLTSLLNTNSQIAFTPPVGDQYKSLTLGSYVGQGAVLSLNTFLDADDSPSDLFVIDGGSASGNTGLVINNTLGAGALTTGNGILVIEALNDGTTGEDAFSLAGPVAAGPYEYSLYQGGLDGTLLNNWYLRSVTADDEPNYRPEVSLYAAIPSNLLLYTRSLLDGFHERVGEEEQVQQRKHAPLYRSFFNGSWVRVLNRQGSINNHGALNDGPAFNYRIYALQAGFDVYHHQYDTGHRDFIGFFGTGGDNRSNVEHYTLEKAGSANFRAYGAGLYLTHITPNGAYLDGVFQANWFDLHVSSSSQTLRSSTADIYAYSLEGGIPILLGKQWSIEPQAQVVYQSLPGFNSFDSASAVYINTTESLISRLSGRLVWNRDPIESTYPKKRPNLSVWFTPSIAYEGRGNSTTQFSSNAGWVPFPSTLKGAWFSMNIGSTMQVNDYVSLYGTLLGETYLNGRGKAYNAMLGCRVNL